VWGIGQSLVALTGLQLVALTLYPIAAQLVPGLPLTWERLDGTIDGVLNLVSLLLSY
jgi:hypothetical protein